MFYIHEWFMVGKGEHTILNYEIRPVRKRNLLEYGRFFNTFKYVLINLFLSISFSFKPSD